jgi:CubicO group peptidase (beta-lactamase class C family)
MMESRRTNTQSTHAQEAAIESPGAAGRQGAYGEIEPGYEPLYDAFAANFTERGDIGAALCVYHHGRKVVDLWGGWADPKSGRPYAHDALQLVFSTTKAATALCAHLLVQRGDLDLDAPVSTYWEDFSQAGKATIPVRWLLTHQAGLPTIDAELSLAQALQWRPVVEALAGQPPYWEPGSAHGYHALTFGWLVGEVVRRVSGRSVGRFFAEEVADPLDLDFWIGLPEEAEPRVVPLLNGPMPDLANLDAESLRVFAAMLEPGALALRALSLNGAFVGTGGRGGPFNSREVHSAEIPAANGITDARSLARMYAAMIGDVDGIRLLDPAVLDRARAPAVDGPDRVLLVPTRFGLGFMCNSSFSELLGESSFGHSGAGGSLGFADVDSGIAFGYVMNQLRIGLAGDQRTTALIEALRSCLD